MSVRRIIDTFEAWRARAEPLVLATVYDTLGSTYSKPGHRILLAASGDYEGLVSGGCLEGDLAERARTLLAEDRPAAVTYDLRDSAEELFGLGIGCNGLLRIFLQPLTAARGYQPFAAIVERLRGSEPAVVATVIEGAQRWPAGTTAVCTAAEAALYGAEAAAAAPLVARARALLGAQGWRLEHAAGSTVLYAPLQPIPRLLVLGAGLDAVPLVSMATDLGWRVTVADHRPAYLQRGGFERAERAVLVEPGALAAELPLTVFDGIVVMSHHLTTDRRYLAQLAGLPAKYLGVLGPRARKERLLADLGAAAGDLTARLKGPVGIDIGADSPEAIALSILAELQRALGERAHAAAQ